MQAAKNNSGKPPWTAVVKTLKTCFERCREIPSHKDIKTAMIYTHVLNRGGKGVKNPVENP
jgi:hypothetical protein